MLGKDHPTGPSEPTQPPRGIMISSHCEQGCKTAIGNWIPEWVLSSTTKWFLLHTRSILFFKLKHFPWRSWLELISFHFPLVFWFTGEYCFVYSAKFCFDYISHSNMQRGSQFKRIWRQRDKGKIPFKTSPVVTLAPRNFHCFIWWA